MPGNDRRWGSTGTPFRFLSIGAYSAPRGHYAPAHRHAAWKVAYYRTGRAEAIIDGHRFETVPGTVLSVPPNAAHAERATTAYSNYFALIDAPSRLPWPPACHDTRAADLRRIFNGLVGENTRADVHAPRMVDALITQLDILLRRRHCQATLAPAERTVLAAERLFEDNYAAPVRMSEVAETAGVSPSTLRASFQAVREMSPSCRLRQVRLTHAVALLTTSDLPLSAIAARCGFHSASHLSRHVKRVWGQSPGALRRGSTARASSPSDPARL